jgi:hypothetical protein
MIDRAKVKSFMLYKKVPKRTTRQVISEPATDSERVKLKLAISDEPDVVDWPQGLADGRIHMKSRTISDSDITKHKWNYHVYLQNQQSSGRSFAQRPAQQSVNDYMKHKQLFHPCDPSYNSPHQGITSTQGDNAGLFIVEPSDANSESEFLAKTENPGAAPEIDFFTHDFKTELQPRQDTRQYYTNTTQEQPAVKPSSNKEFRDTFQFGKELDEFEAELLKGAENDTSWSQGQENNPRMQLSTANLQHLECWTISPMQDNFFERPLEIHKQGNNEDTDQFLEVPQKKSGTESKRLSLEQIVKRTSAKILKIGTTTDEGSDISKNGQSQISQWDGSSPEASFPNSPIKRIFNKLQPRKEDIESGEAGEQGYLDTANHASSKFVFGQNIQ